MRNAVVLSIVVHAALFGAARPMATRVAALTERETAYDAPDRWVGTSIEVSTDQGKPDGRGDSTAARAPSPKGAEAPMTPPASPGGAAQPSAPVSDPPAPTAGSTAPKSPSAAPRPPPLKRARKPGTPRAPRPSGSAEAKVAGSATAAADGGSAAPGGRDGTFGSDGQAAVRDLGRAFTRAIPAACSADPIWAKVALGDAGTLRVELRVNAEGHLTSAEPSGDNRPTALVNVVRRTVPLLQAGTFAVRGGAVTAGSQTIEIKAVVAEAGGDAESGGRENLAFSYEGGRGMASFTQAGGRRVKLSVRVVKSEVAP